jgi:diaminopimelate decarboxylase
MTMPARIAHRVSVAGGPAQESDAPVASCVEEIVERAPELLDVANAYGSPLYLLEPDVLRQRARRFAEAFAAVLPDVRIYYALKSNNLEAVTRTFVEAGLGIDVSSGLELQQALAAGCRDIIFSGPGKTAAELDAAIDAAGEVIVLLDSFGELERLQERAAARGVRMRAGARLSTHECGLWRKFGVPLDQLARLLDAAARCSHVRLEGLQYHMSWLLQPDRQVAFIRDLGAVLARLPAAHRRAIRFLDIGGGFWPPEGEWLHADPEAMLAGGERGAGDAAGGRGDGTRGSEGGAAGAGREVGPAAQGGGAARPAIASPLRPPAPRILPATGIDEFAAAIAAALQEHVLAHIDCRIHVEPGRWLCSDAMHILITVVDKKADDLVIADAGTNALGWERFESDYFPLVNLTRPGLTERVCTVFGSLCTPHDVWGFSVHGAGIEAGDVLLVPRQGAYTYSLRQRFIKPLPEVVTRGPGGWAR